MFYLVKSRLTKRKAIVTEINFKTTLPQKLNKAHLKKWYMVHMGNVDDEVKEYKHHNILAYGGKSFIYLANFLIHFIYLLMNIYITHSFLLIK